MQIEKFLVGIILTIIGAIGIINSNIRRSKKKDDSYGSNTQYLFGSIGVLAVGLYLIFQEITSLL